MVVSLVGRINNGPSMPFLLNDLGKWTITVPQVPSGAYAVELIAIDDAGNESYFATMLFTVDAANLVYTFEVIEYATDIHLDDLATMLTTDDYELSIEQSNFVECLLDDPFEMTVYTDRRL